MAGGRGPRRYSPVTVSPSEVAQLLTVLMSGMAGLVVGSFLNVAVYRLPLEMSVVQPPSHCPSCASRLTVVDLVPVLSWLWLRGRCRHCGTRISWRYPAVELGVGLLCAAAAGALGSVWPLPSVAVVVVCALGAAIVDAGGAAVPLAFALVGALAAGSLLPIAAALGHADRLAWAALGAALGSSSGFVVDRSDGRQRWARTALLASLAWTAGWLWPGGGACVAGWMVLATAAAGLRARRRAPFAILVAGSVVGVLASALISRP
jgi:leader peptidase (prepilin peptidase)/N-methyltransferase